MSRPLAIHSCPLACFLRVCKTAALNPLKQCHVQGVRVRAAPLFIPELTQLSQGERQYFFAYR